MNKEKEKALEFFLEMIIKSWTYNRMTEEEQQKMFDLFHSNRIKGSLKGSFKIRWEVLNSIYYSYLVGIGYDNHDWRS